MKYIVIVIILAAVAYFGYQYFTNKSSVEVPDTEVVTEEQAELNIPENAFVVDTEASSITWEGKKVLGGHVGTVTFASGYMTEDMQGVFAVDMSTIFTEDGDAVINHLKSDDFFSVERYPESTFVVTSYEDGMLNGELTVRGVSQEVSIPAQLTIDGDTLSITSDYQLNRVDYDITFRSGSFFDDLGDNLINDLVDLHIEVRAQR